MESGENLIYNDSAVSFHQPFLIDSMYIISKLINFVYTFQK